MENELTELASTFSDLNLTYTRSNEILADSIEKIASLTKSINESRKLLTKEVVDLKTANETIQETIALSVVKAQPLLVEAMAQGVKHQFSEDYKRIEDRLQKLSHQIESLGFKAAHVIEKREKRLTKKGVFVCIAVCLSSFVTAGGIFYFFPQTVILNRTLNTQDYRTLQRGELLRHTMKKMPKAEKEKLEDALNDSWKEYYQELGRALALARKSK
jgi:hypothetical protein